MLDDKRVLEAESNVRQYLEESMLKKLKNETAKVMYIENSHISLFEQQQIGYDELYDFMEGWLAGLCQTF